MKIYPHFFRNRQRKDGMFPIYIYITQGSRRFCVNSGIYSSVVFEGNIFPTTEKNHRAKTKALTDMLDDIERLVFENIKSTNMELKAMIESRILRRRKEESPTLVNYIRQYAETCVATRTKESYMSTANKVQEYDEDADLNITKSWLEMFEEKMAKDGLTVNSYGAHMRNIRSVFNWAIKNEITENYPFRLYKIKKERTRKRNLSAETLRSIIFMEVKPRMERYRDFFALSLFLAGINPIDLLTAKPEQLDGDRLYYKRRKTHKDYYVKVEPEAMALIEKYKGKDYLLKFCDTAQYENFLHSANLFLRSVRPGLTMYWARHSFASIAVELDIPIETVSAALGHSHGEEVTQVYVNYEQKKVDKANRKVMDYILYNKEGD